MCRRAWRRRERAAWIERSVLAGQRHSELLLPMIASLLAEHGPTLTALTGIAFGAGPGSFTGLRIACGVAQGLAFGADLPLVGVCTLEAMAQTARQQADASPASGKRIVAALDARMHEVYVAAYEQQGDNMIGARFWRRSWSRPTSHLPWPETAGPASATVSPLSRSCERAAATRGRRQCETFRRRASAIGVLALPRLSRAWASRRATRRRSTCAIVSR